MFFIFFNKACGQNIYLELSKSQMDRNVVIVEKRKGVHTILVDRIDMSLDSVNINEQERKTRLWKSKKPQMYMYLTAQQQIEGTARDFNLIFSNVEVDFLRSVYKIEGSCTYIISRTNLSYKNEFKWNVGDILKECRLRKTFRRFLGTVQIGSNLNR